MANDTTLSNNDVATLIVSFAQIIGFIAVIACSGPVGAVIAGIAGFAAVVKYFLPIHGNRAWIKKLNAVSAICGVGLIVFAIVSVS